MKDANEMVIRITYKRCENGEGDLLMMDSNGKT